MSESDTVLIEVELEAELAQAILAAVEVGAYATPDEVVAAALQDWREKQERRSAAVKAIQEAWDEGLASGMAPRRRTADEIIADGRRRLAARKTA